jgi:uncharacterized cupin superfamily protein
LKIELKQTPSPEKLRSLGVETWPIWTKEPSTFPWHYDSAETCYILEGEAIVTPQSGGEPVTIQEGNLVRFPAGLSCTWQVLRPIRKHYRLE